MPSSSTASPPVAAAVEHDSDVVELRPFAKSAGDVETAAPAEASTSAASADAEEVVDPEERWADLERIGGDEIDKLFAGLREKHVPAMEGVMESLRGLTRDLRESDRRMRETGEIVDEQVRELRAFQEKLAERWESIKATDASLDQKEARLQQLIAENAKRFNNADE